MDIESTQNKLQAELKFGEQNGQLLHISEVKSGLDCDCICPGCKTPLIARKGEVRTHHFAHHQGQESESCIETTLHRFAKQVIASHKKVRIPEDHISASSVDKAGKIHTARERVTSEMIDFEEVGLEVLKPGYRSDATGYPYEQQDLDIEIRVTHEVDNIKKQKVQEANTCMMEIDLSGLDRDASPEAIAIAVISEAPRKWIHNPVHLQLQKKLQQKADLMMMQANQAMEEHERQNDAPLTPSHPDHFILLGYKTGHGYSPRYQKNFELSKLYTVRQVVSTNTRNFTVTGSGGYEMEEFDLDESCIRKLESLEYPTEVSLTMGSKLQGRKFVPVVLDIKVL
ncbi:hypothetical protein [Endozoicomonas sp. 8E]|uniref:competence protein CoiA family protein n=1 Tax=Endozoicomonas sp. 8E TaxID=3035692 RepID=UPI00293943E0|nr:hypothetical protein [Endozoicomonas sp. 8E]WOG29910.1 hypothetical protein P6910_09710 [Endozoicomonas sp. 8E]